MADTPRFSVLIPAYSADGTLEELLRACFYGTGAVFRREVFETVGGFREDIYAEDYLFWLLALAHGYRHRHLDVPLSVHRREKTQKSSDALRMRETDVRVIEEMAASGLLSTIELVAARRSLAALRRNVRIRKTLGMLLGARLSSWLIDVPRGCGHRLSRRGDGV